MSGDRLPEVAVDNYLQFTPLASAAPVRSIVDSFVVPRAITTPVVGHARENASRSTSDYQQIFSRILQQAHISRGQSSFRDTFASQSPPDHDNQPVNEQVTELWRTYRSQVAEKLSQNHENARSGVQNSNPHTNEVITPVASIALASPVLPLSNVSINELYADEVHPPKRTLPSLSKPSSTPIKRGSSGSEGPQTPTNHRKRHKLDSNATSKDASNLQEEVVPLLANFQSQQAALIQQAQSFIEDIFEAEDSLECHTTDAPANAFFSTHESHKGLSLEATQKLLLLLKRIQTAEGFGSLDREYILRLHRIILRSISTSDSEKLHELEDNLNSERAQQQWLESIKCTLNAVMSALCSICIMEAFPLENEVCSEETLLLLVDCLKSVLENLYFRWFSETSLTKFGDIEHHKKFLDSLLQSSIGLLDRLSTIFVALEVPENIVCRIIFMSVATIFVETPRKQNKICSHLIVESLKMSAVATLQRIFAKFQAQRQFILDEVLMCLNKLPSNRQSARQFKLANGKSIQLASALLLHLVHASSAPNSTSVTLTEENVVQEFVSDKTTIASTLGAEIPVELHGYTRRYAAAEQVGRHIINFLLEKSMKSSKSITTEEAPFKALLDVFIEDFVTVLNLPEWPAAELMLRWIANNMLRLVDDPKTGAQVKVSAVDALCSIACKVRASCLIITELSKSGPSPDLLEDLPSFEISETTTARQLARLEEVQTVLAIYLIKCAKHDSTYRASLDFTVSYWIQFLTKSLRQSPEVGDVQRTGTLSAIRIMKMHGAQDDSGWVAQVDSPLADNLLSRAHMQLMSFSGLLHMFEVILSRLLTMMGHTQITLRTKTLRSFGRLSEVDSSILSLKSVQSQIALRISDSSPQVRDVAIDLLGKHISANPHSGVQYYPELQARILDTGLSVRKRVLRLCKELYMKHADPPLRIDIARQFLGRIHDEEDSIQELVLKSLEIMWFSPLIADQTASRPDTSPLSMQESQELSHRAAIISALTADQNEGVAEAVKYLLVQLHDTTSSKEAFSILSALLVQSFLANVIERSDDESRLTGLIALRLFAQAVPDAFASSQVESLLPYLQFGQSRFEQNAPAYVASIYTAVLPRLATLNSSFQLEVQSSLMAQLTKLPIKTLNEAVPCLCTVVQLRRDYVRAAGTLKSCLQRLLSLSSAQGKSNAFQDKQVILLLHLVGLFGRYLQIQDPALLKGTFGSPDKSHLIESLISSIMPFCHSESHGRMNVVEKTALRSLGNICISDPSQFQGKRVLAFTDALMAGVHTEAKKILLEIYVEYLNVEQRKTDGLTRIRTTNGDSKHATNKKKRTKKGELAEVDVEVLTGNTDRFATDGISPALMQRYLPHILQLSLGADLSLAVVAADLIANIVTQGLSNPRNCMPTIIALETSSEFRLRVTAAKMHRTLYEKHESLIESCYGDGIEAAFNYRLSMGNIEDKQKEVAPLSVLYSIVKASRRGRQKFLTTFARRLDTDLDKIDSLKEKDVLYALFLAQTAAYLEYITNEEVHLVIHAIDKILSTTGTSLLQALEEHSQVEQMGAAAAILCLSITLRAQLKLVYSIAEGRCTAFEPSKLNSRSDLKVAVRKPDIALAPDWSFIKATANGRIEVFKMLFDRADQRAPSEGVSSPEKRDNDEEVSDTAFAHMASVAGTLDNGT